MDAEKRWAEPPTLNLHQRTGALTGTRLANMPCQPAYSRRLDQGNDRNAHGEELFDLREQLRGFERVSAKLKEIIFSADLVFSKTLLPELGQPQLDGVLEDARVRRRRG